MTSLPHCKAPCSGCPFRQDSLKGWLGAERMQRILQIDNFVCHEKTHLQCAGHMLMRGQDNTFVQIATRLNLPLALSGRELLFDTPEQCVAHHSNDK